MKSTISETASIRDALQELKRTGLGITCIVDSFDVVRGVVTDGDIRRVLLENNDLDVSISSIMNSNFVYANENDTRQDMMKKFDMRVKVLPILDRRSQLITLSQSLGPVPFQKASYFRARAPGRISIAGGGTDFTNYFINNEGCGLALSIAKFAHATLRPRLDREVNIYSGDFNETLHYDSFEQIDCDKKLPLITTGIKLLKPNFGFDLEVGSDFPPGSGLGGSASILTAMAGVFTEAKGDKISKQQIAEFAFQVERLELGVSGGWQDQYATVYGGLNYLEFSSSQNEVMPIRLDIDAVRELEERLVLCYTGQSHRGEKIQNRNIKQSNLRTLEVRSELKEIVKKVKIALLSGDIIKFAELLTQTWHLKKLENPDTAGPEIDEIFSLALKNGALGGRLLGTGGGGFFIFVSDICRRFELINTLEEAGYKTENVKLHSQGLVTWKV